MSKEKLIRARDIHAKNYANDAAYRAAYDDLEKEYALRSQELGDLKTDIDKGLADIKSGRVSEFDPQEIIRQGEELLAAQKLRSE